MKLYKMLYEENQAIRIVGMMFELVEMFYNLDYWKPSIETLENRNFRNKKEN